MNKARKGQHETLGPGGAWAMAVGGMIGGGIFSTLGVVISVAGEWAWLSFLLGGIVAYASGHSYSALTRGIGKSGGSYAYLREMGYRRLAQITVWVLVIGYTLTVAVYAVTFGSYAANAFGAPSWVVQFAAVASIAVLFGVNLAGVNEATIVELVAVWGKLVILLGLAALGLAQWNPVRLELDEGNPVGISGAVIGMGVVFMAYEGFQLLSYDYRVMRDPARTIRRAMPLAIVTTTVTYVLVALGAAMLAGAGEIVAHEEVALAVAGRDALGVVGFIAVSIAATFSAGSAINATVFATARLAGTAADDGDMPGWFNRRNAEGTPWLATLIISVGAAAMVFVGGIESLIEGASLVFLSVFALVNWIAIERRIEGRWLAYVGLGGSAAGAIMLAVYLTGIA